MLAVNAAQDVDGSVIDVVKGRRELHGLICDNKHLHHAFYKSSYKHSLCGTSNASESVSQSVAQCLSLLLLLLGASATVSASTLHSCCRNCPCLLVLDNNNIIQHAASQRHTHTHANTKRAHSPSSLSASKRTLKTQDSRLHSPDSKTKNMSPSDYPTIVACDPAHADTASTSDNTSITNNSDNDSNNNNSSASSNDAHSPRVSIFPVPQWSNTASIRTGALDCLVENKIPIALAAPVGSAYTFWTTYKADASSKHGRYQRALRPALMAGPMWATLFAGGFLTYEGTRALFAEERKFEASLLASSLIGASVNIGSGPRAMARGAMRVSACYIAGWAAGASFFLLREQFADADSTDADADEAS